MTQSAWTRLRSRLRRHPVTSVTIKVVVTLAGLAVMAAGLVMLVTPGPGVVAIAGGLAILAKEYAWAERWLASARRRVVKAAEQAREMDPALRRRRIAIGSAGVLATVGAVAGYVSWRDWPRWSVAAWDRAQGIAAFLPELPGM